MPELYNLDCIEMLQQLGAFSIDCIWTDPPYFLSNGGTTCKSGKRSSVHKGDWDKASEDSHPFNIAWLTQCYRVLRPGGTIWVSGTFHNIYSVGFAMQTIGFRVLNEIIWIKRSPPPNLACRSFTHAHETIIWATKPGARHTLNYDWVKATNGGKQQKDIFDFGRPTREEKAFGKHPTQKPVELVKYCLQSSTKPGDTVLDPFMGSGTTGVAAIELGLNFIGCEKEAEYFQLATQRIENTND